VRGKRGPQLRAASKTPTCVWTLVTVGGLSRYCGSEPNDDVSFDCGPGPDYRVLLVYFRSVRHTLSTASPSGSRSPCPLGPARKRPFAGIPGHVGEMCLTDSSSSLLMPVEEKLHPSTNPNRAARNGFRRSPKNFGRMKPREEKSRGIISPSRLLAPRDIIEGSTVSTKCEFATLALLILTAPSGWRPSGVAILKFNSRSAKGSPTLAYEDMTQPILE
jgi:hypothetical protein